MIIPNIKYKISNSKLRFSRGSAIILAVVLTSLLAIVGVMFLLSSRVDSIATSAITDNKDLNLAVDTVISQISEKLAFDVFGGTIDPNQYADYPDPCNPWLACLEPYRGVSDYLWRQVSDIYDDPNLISQNVIARIIPDYNNSPSFGIGTAADADGDGVGDSIWVQVRDVNSSRGKPIYAAIRIVDNSGMLNVNTGFKFDPDTADGSSQMQIDLMALSWRPFDPNSTYDSSEEDDLLQVRASADPYNLGAYQNDVVWQYGNSGSNYTPFDISDELEMRYSFVLDYVKSVARIETWGGEMRNKRIWTPITSGDFNKWTTRVAGTDTLDPNYSYRHIATTYNLDRIIAPDGNKMFNINLASSANKYVVRDRIEQAVLAAGLDTSIYDANQITVNLIDYIDGSYYAADDPRYDPNNEVAVVYDANGIPYFGFEQPCIYISEIAQRFIHFDNNTPDANSYAIELYKPYWYDSYPSATDPNDAWRLLIGSMTAIPIIWTGTPRFHVIEFIDLNAPIVINFYDVNGPNDVNGPPDVNEPNAQPAYVAFSGGSLVELQRFIPDTDRFLTVDYVFVPQPNDTTGWLIPIDINSVNDIRAGLHSYQRDIGFDVNNVPIGSHKLVRGRPIAPGVGLWSLDFGDIPPPSLGGPNPWTAPEPYVAPYVIQAHPENRPFTNIGEVGMLFRKDAYDANVLDSDSMVKLDLADPNFQRIFNYLTVFDPTIDLIDNDSDGYIDELDEPNTPELKIKGRININTAPWFVLAQLPWISQRIGQPDDVNLARSIISYRDKVNLNIAGVADYSGRDGLPGFKNIGELMNVNLVTPDDPCSSIFSYRNDSIDLLAFPDMTPNDGAIDDFEERDAIFARISNLVTVRSDVFTAYILVRIGRDGPQKRVVAILDRSDVRPLPAGGYTGKVRVVAIQQVPDPR